MHFSNKFIELGILTDFGTQMFGISGDDA